jgi:protein gp37
MTMAIDTRISWTDATYNPFHGCRKLSPGCANCYMYTAKARYGQDPAQVVQSAPATFRAPLKWQRALVQGTYPGKHHGDMLLVFTCSWSDFFIEEADAWRHDVWAIIRQTPNLLYQILTKRPERIAEHLPADWGLGYPNVWLGVSVENRRWLGRLDTLLQIPAVVRFVSFEPLVGDVGDITPWLGGSYEANVSGRARVSGCFTGGIDDQRVWRDLEGGCQGGQQMERGEPHPFLFSQAGRADQGRLSFRAGDVQPYPSGSAGPQGGLQTFLWNDSLGPDSEPQKRAEEGQSSKQFGTHDIFRTIDACAPCSEAWSDRPERRKECDGQIGYRTDQGNTDEESGRRTTSLDSKGFQSERQGYIQNSPRRPLGGISWVIIGGESGSPRRPMAVEWLGNVVSQCQAAGVATWVKQASAFKDGQQGNIPDHMWQIKELPYESVSRRAI